MCLAEAERAATVISLPHGRGWHPPARERRPANRSRRACGGRPCAESMATACRRQAAALLSSWPWPICRGIASRDRRASSRLHRARGARSPEARQQTLRRRNCALPDRQKEVFGELARASIPSPPFWAAATAACRPSCAVEANVRRTVRDVLESPEGRARTAEGEMKLVGAVYDLATGRVRFLD